MRPLLNGSVSAFQVIAPFLLIVHLGLSPEQFSLVVMSTAVAYFAGSQIVYYLAERVDGDRLLSWGIVACALGAGSLIACALLVEQAIWGVMVPMYLINIGIGLIAPTTAAKAIQIFPKNGGVASGFREFVLLTMTGVITFGVTQFDFTSALPLGVFAFCSTMLGSVLFWRLTLRESPLQIRNT